MDDDDGQLTFLWHTFGLVRDTNEERAADGESGGRVKEPGTLGLFGFLKIHPGLQSRRSRFLKKIVSKNLSRFFSVYVSTKFPRTQWKTCEIK